MGAIALFAGASFTDKRLAFGLPLMALLMSDLFLGFYDGVAYVYGGFALIVGLGLWLRSRRTPTFIAVGAVASAILFFVVSNFGVWAAGAHDAHSMYPFTLAGLGACYVAAIPFFQNTLISQLFYTAGLFGVAALAETKFPRLREPALA